MSVTETPQTLWDALLTVQAHAPKLQKDKINPAFKGTKYVSLDKLMSEVLPVLSHNGLVWVTLPVYRPEGPVLHYRLIHAATAMEIEGEMPLMLGRQDPQSFGSAITYARRYSLMAVLGLVANEDDDAQAASKAPRKNQSQAAARPLTGPERAKVIKAIEDAGNDEDGLLMILAAVGAESTDDLTTGQAFEIRKLLDGGQDR